VPGLAVECGGHPADGAAAMTRILATHPDVTAVVTATDLRAVGAVQAIRAAGRRVPEGISVVGYHDSKVTLEQVPQLTTVRLPAYEMGRQAVLLLRALLVSEAPTPTGREVPAELVLRASTARAPDGNERAPRKTRRTSRP
jgi:DNA-binding LacI/PurR family transcriptional regulator